MAGNISFSRHIPRFAMQSEHRAIIIAVLNIALFVLLGKAIGAAKEIAIAWRFGTDAHVDAYLFLFSIVAWPTSVFFGTIYATLIPIAARVKAKSVDALAELRSEVLGVTLVTSTVIAALFAVLLHAIIEGHLLGLSQTQRGAAQDMLSPLIFLIPLGFLTALWSTWTLFSGRQIGTLFEATPAFVILCWLLVDGSSNALTYGTVIGFVVWAVLLIAHMRARNEIEGPRFSMNSSAWSDLRLALGSVLIAQLLTSGAGILDQFFAAGLGEGALAKLGYASRLIGLVLGLGATAIGRAVLPVFSHAHAKDQTSLPTLAKRWCLLTLATGTVGMAVGMLCAPLGVSLLFERGAFNADDTHEVAQLVRIGLLQLPFSIATVVATYALHSQGKQTAVTKIAAVGFLLKLALNACLIPFGTSGLLLSTALVMAAMFILTYQQLSSGK